MARAPQLAEISQQPPTDDMGQEAAPAADWTVVCTVLKDAGGAYKVVAGDEPEGGGAMEEGGAMPREETQPAETFDGVGPTLKAVMDILQADADGPDGPNAQFQEGYAGPGGAPPAPAA